MSQRLGPADGRAFTIATSSKLLDNYVMKTHNIDAVDNYSYRALLQSQGPQVIHRIQNLQEAGQRPAPSQVNVCYSADRPLLKIPGIY
jgi:hypothetical protein